MTTQEMAAKLNNIQYQDLQDMFGSDGVLANDMGSLCVIHPYSDDVVVFNGDLYDEASAEKKIYFNRKEVYFDDMEANKKDFPFWVKGVYKSCWEFTTNIPNITKFMIFDGKHVYGEGLVFDLNDLVEPVKMKSREEIEAKIKELEKLIDCEGSEAFVSGLKWCLGQFKL